MNPLDMIPFDTLIQESVGEAKTEYQVARFVRELGVTVHAARMKTDLGPEDAASDADLSLQRYVEIETGTSCPTLRELVQIAGALNLSLRVTLEPEA